MMRCEICKFFEAKSANGAKGVCRRHAPKPADGMSLRFPIYDQPEDVFYRPAWPMMERHEWCGEWQAKSPPKERMMPGDPILMTQDQVETPTIASTAICYVCGHTVKDNGTLSSEGWIHAKCTKAAEEGTRWIKGLDCDTEDRTDVATDSGSGQLSSVPKPVR